MIKVFGGSDTYESYSSAKKFAEKRAKEKGLEMEIVEVDDISGPAELMQKIEGIGMFTEEKLIFAKRLFKNRKVVDYFGANFEKIKGYEIVIWEGSKPDGKLKLAKLLKKEKCIELHELQKPWQIEKWVADVCRAKKIPLSKAQISYLVERTSDDKWVLINELQKIFLFLDGKKSISDDELRTLIGLESRGDIWKFVEFLMDRNIKESLIEFDKLNRYEDNVFYVLAMIQREVSLLTDVLIKKNTDQDYKSLGIHPFVLQKTIKNSNKYSLDDLYIMQLELVNIETKIKKGELPERLALQEFLIQKT